MEDRTALDILISGELSYKIKVPYKLIETGQKGKRKPLIFYLHGFNDHLESFLNRCSSFVHQVKAYHLFIQGPYPIYNRKKEKKIKQWGRAWYLYDGEQDQFIRSMEDASEFIQEIIDFVKGQIAIERTCVIGYSMGGYLAGYFAMTRPDYLNDLIVAGARIKTEVLAGAWESIRHIQVLALHGENDNIVDYKPQRSEIKRLTNKGVSANFKLINQKHIFNEEFISEVRDWLFEKGYDNQNSFSIN